MKKAVSIFGLAALLVASGYAFTHNKQMKDFGGDEPPPRCYPFVCKAPR